MNRMLSNDRDNKSSTRIWLVDVRGIYKNGTSTRFRASVGIAAIMINSPRAEKIPATS